MPLKLLSDFDGVWTDQAIEAEGVLLYTAAEAARLAGIAQNRALADFRAFEAEVLSRPELHGWAPDGRISAYVDEDPFCRSNAIARLIEGAHEPRPRTYRQAIEAAGFPSVGAFADRCFLGATERFRRDHPPALVPGAEDALRGLLELGIELVIVSNSPAEKIQGWFGALGLELPGPERFRVRGSARKFALGASQAGFDLGGRRVLVDRPHYRAILEQERPAWVVGDVFSLDLALPEALRREGRPDAPRGLILRRHIHTPSWVLDAARGGPIDRLIEHPAELAALLQAELRSHRDSNPSSSAR
jgi:phosphoglycolate phosphatase-like HAD superfamily hydrolase